MGGWDAKAPRVVGEGFLVGSDVGVGGVERESMMVVGPMVVVAKVVMVIVVEVTGSQLAVVKWWFCEGVWRFGRQGAMVLRSV